MAGSGSWPTWIASVENPIKLSPRVFLVVDRERRGLRNTPRLRTMAGERDRACGSDTLFGFLRVRNRQGACAAADSSKLAQATRAVKLRASPCDAVVRIVTATGEWNRAKGSRYSSERLYPPSNYTGNPSGGLRCLLECGGAGTERQSAFTVIVAVCPDWPLSLIHI